MNKQKNIKFIVDTSVRIMSSLSLRSLHILGKILGLALWYFLPKRKKYAIDTISKRLHLDKKNARQIAKQSYINTGYSFLELFYVGRFGIKELNKTLTIENSEIYQKLRTIQRPIVIVTAHLGAWELLAGLLGDCKDDKEAQVIVRHMKNPIISEAVFKLRAANGAEVLDSRHVAPKVLKTLAKNGISGFLVDHNTKLREAIFLPFLEEQAAVNSGPAILALRARAIVFPVFLIRSFDKKTKKPHYTLRLEEPLDTKTLNGSLREQIHYVAEYYTQAVEKYIKQYPEQWFWMHRRWKTRENQNK
ncbi:lysophospholipid acyltransferase family protein [Desulfovibrio litoralis]|uniref:KDO2-lipid IV(A) lauroyltransferase n=1 Tax=Desulfovibrio litoralis DSM 11393 TaxID=1121455 RepID=A0A1M7SX25_9BACT|nr:lysophospholipid acyltransferase family protein [Desulfovibrio litoralis]SHN63075.1 KDO2-lipid IV(A) lauroyltransferase [Desulfovibrio litoralis DSM 11393]